MAAVPWEAKQQEIVDELRNQVVWSWGHLNAEQLVTLTRLALTPSDERVHQAMWDMIEDGSLVLDDDRRFTAPVKEVAP